MRATTSIHHRIVAEIVVAFGYITSATPFRSGNDTAKQRKRSGFENPLLAVMIAQDEAEKAAAFGTSSTRRGHRCVLLHIRRDRTAESDRSGITPASWWQRCAIVVAFVQTIHLLALLHQLNHFTERYLQWSVDDGQVAQQLRTIYVTAAEKVKKQCGKSASNGEVFRKVLQASAY